MEGKKSLSLVFLLLVFQLSKIECRDCQTVSELSGVISDYSSSTYGYEQCWNIILPENSFIRMKIHLNMRHPCERAHVQITEEEATAQHFFCSSSRNFRPFTAESSVTVTHRINPYKDHGNYNPYYSSFRLEYQIMDLLCAENNTFQCNNYTCVPLDKICDGVEDCESGADEEDCVGILDISGIDEARDSAIYWLRSRRDYLKSEELPRAVVALFLGSGANFNGTDLEEELLATRVELNTAASLLKSSLTSTDLSMFINALLVTCHNPRKFYGQNLVMRLKEQVEKTEDFVHPSAYLTLCNANETWPKTAESHLERILNIDLEYPFTRDLQATAAMALSCKINLDKRSGSPSSYNFTSYYDVIEKLKDSQLSDGSFGNVYTTALITQALIASGEALKSDWNLNATFEFLMNEINSSFVDFLTIYYTLPLFNGKTLADISTINCSFNPRKQGYALDSLETGGVVRTVQVSHGINKMHIENDSRPKMRIMYSLYIGDEKDVIHTISLRVAENSTAFEVMKSVAVEDPKFSFKAKAVAGKIYVHRIGQITNDPDMGKYWLLHVGADNCTDTLTHLTTSPDKLILRNGQHLVYWHKTASL